MSLTLRVDIVSAEAQIYSGLAQQIILPGQMGEMGVLPRHTPLMTRLRAGLVRVQTGTDEEEVFFVYSGLAEIQPHVVTVLADTALRSNELDAQQAMAAKERAEQALRGDLSRVDHQRMETELKITIALLRAIDELRLKRH